MGLKIRQRPSPDPSPNSTSEQRAVQLMPALVHSRDSKPLPTGATASYEQLTKFVGPALPCLL